MRTPPRAYQRRHRRERRPTRSVARTGSWTRSFPAPRRWSAGCTRQGGTATTPNGRGHSLDHDELGHGAEALRLHYRYVDAACDPTAAVMRRRTREGEIAATPVGASGSGGACVKWNRVMPLLPALVVASSGNRESTERGAPAAWSRSAAREGARSTTSPTSIAWL